MSVKQQIQSEVSQERYEKMKKQTVWIACMSITIFFTGFISAYVVQSSDEVWYSFQFPISFTYSSIAIILSSCALFGSVLMARKNNQKGIKLMLGLTLVLGLLFTYFQFKGWGEMMNNNNMISGGFVNDVGMYGKDYYFTKDGKVATHNGLKYEVEGKELNEKEVAGFRAISRSICKAEVLFSGQNLSFDKVDGVEIYRASDSVQLKFDGNQIMAGETMLSTVESGTLFSFAVSVKRGMEFFKNNLVYGQDFAVKFNGEKMEFKDKMFYYKRLELNEDELAGIKTDVFLDGRECKLENGIVRGLDGTEIDMSKVEYASGSFRAKKTDFPIKCENGKWIRERTKIHLDDYPKLLNQDAQSSSYRWVVTILHFLHLFGGLIYLLVLFINALNNKFSASNHLKIKTGSIYWHFLGGLWLFLFFFFQYYD